MSGAAKCCAHHGLSLAVTIRTGADQAVRVDLPNSTRTDTYVTRALCQ